MEVLKVVDADECDEDSEREIFEVRETRDGWTCCRDSLWEPESGYGRLQC